MNYVYDIETLSNCFTVVFSPVGEGEDREFVIHKSRNDGRELLTFLNEVEDNKGGLIGFNNKFFDWPVLDYFMSSGLRPDPEITARLLYAKAQGVINSGKKVYIKERIPQLDLYLINHFDNKNRMTSLKALQCAIKWKNVQDMPIHHSSTIEEDQIEEILKYNRNDVHSTAAFYFKCLKKIELRKKMSTKFKGRFINSSDVGMGEAIFIKYLSEAMGMSPSDIRKIKGRACTVNIKDVIFPYVEFRSPEFKSVLDKFRVSKIGADALEEFKKKMEERDSNDIEEFIDILESLNLSLKSTKNKKKGFGARTFIQGVPVEYGIGGVHACVPPGVYDSDERFMIIDSDVKSYYPNLAIRNRLHPRQFPQEAFCSTYERIYDERVEGQKSGDETASDGLKLSLNGPFGKSLEESSCFYDPYFFAGITINGQLLLSMFAEDVLEFIPEAKMLQLNTDGMTFKIPREYELRYMQLASKWMEKTKLVLEHAEYSKMVIRDVNNYIALATNGKVKRKGTFEIEKDYHKDPSFAVIPLAVGEYFIKGTPVSETLRSHEDLYDFSGRYKGTAAYNAMYVYMDYDSNGNPYERRDSYGKIMRYIPTIKGGVGIKVPVNSDKISRTVTYYNEHRELVTEQLKEHTNLLSGRTMTCFNEYFEMDKSLIDYKYFEWQCQKLIESVKIPQLSLV